MKEGLYTLGKTFTTHWQSPWCLQLYMKFSMSTMFQRLVIQEVRGCNKSWWLFHPTGCCLQYICEDRFREGSNSCVSHTQECTQVKDVLRHRNWFWWCISNWNCVNNWVWVIWRTPSLTQDGLVLKNHKELLARKAVYLTEEVIWDLFFPLKAQSQSKAQCHLPHQAGHGPWRFDPQIQYSEVLPGMLAPQHPVSGRTKGILLTWSIVGCTVVL
jgi:hypothetical protein